MPSRRCPVSAGNAPGGFEILGARARGTEAGTGEFENPASCPDALPRAFLKTTGHSRLRRDRTN